MTTPFKNAAVKRAFDSYPPNARKKLLALRELIFNTARNTEGVGALEETLKWGEPAYLTSESKSGSTVRIAWKRQKPTQYAMYFNCQTTLVDTFKSWFPNELAYEGNRAIVFEENDKVPMSSVAHCIEAALTYHNHPVAPKARKLQYE
ncbi:MAG: DUF1801 domain-containing protein [Gemmatimonadaceae bacterium]